MADEKTPVSGSVAPQTTAPVTSTAPETTKETTHSVDLSEPSGHPSGDPNLPTGWMYRQRKIGPITIPWYASPKVQLFMVAMVCFLCPGMFNALGGMGGGGKADATLADDMVSFSFF